MLKRILKTYITIQNRRTLCVLGIETSCDDTAIAIVNSAGEVVAHELDSQQRFHTRYGGIIPPRAQDLHRAKIEHVLERCLAQAATQGITPENLDAIAVTNRPGLPLSLLVGLRFAKHLARRWRKPLVPVHHMEAHALQARMEYRGIKYPFLCLLVSGGHCQLVFVRSAMEFLLLGESLDDAPGEAFDKIARRLRLWLLPQYADWNGGQSVEHAAHRAANAGVYSFPLPLAQRRDCNFSFAGIKNNSYRAIHAAELKEGTPPDCLLSDYTDFCAGLLNAISRHLMHRTQRALEYCIAQKLFTTTMRTLVVSGGVANNDTIFNDISEVAAYYECETWRPSKSYCSDNGAMIAWNGIEKMQVNKNNALRWNYDDIEPQGKAFLGVPLLQEVASAQLKCSWIRTKRLK